MHHFSMKHLISTIVATICFFLTLLACFDPIPLDGIIPLIGGVLTLTIPRIRGMKENYPD